jgi:hypothetical protein
MPSIINASSTGSGGIVQTADASGVLQLQSNGTTALTVSSSQAIGIGTNSPTAQLEISRSATDAYSTMRLSNTGASGKTYEIGVGGNTAASGYANNLYFYDSTAGAIRMAVTSAGAVTQPFQPMVSCYSAGTNGTTLAGHFAIGQAAPNLNVGSYFSTGTYLFTCPVAGNYRISVSASNGDGQSHYIAPVKNNTPISGYGLFYTGFTSAAQSVIVPCSVGDTLGALSRYNTGLYSAQLSIELVS